MNKFKTTRKKNKVSQVELAEYLNVKQATISDWETYKTMPSYDNLIAFAKKFNVSIDYLLGLEEETKNLKLTPEQKETLELLTQMNELQVLKTNAYMLGLLEKEIQSGAGNK